MQVYTIIDQQLLGQLYICLWCIIQLYIYVAFMACCSWPKVLEALGFQTENRENLTENNKFRALQY